MLRVSLAAVGDFEAMPEQGRDGCEALLCSSLAARKVDNERGVSEAGHSAGKPCEGIAFGAMETHGFSESGRFAVDDPTRSLGGAVARPQSGAADGENQRGVLSAEFLELEGDGVFVVGQEAGPGFGFRPKLLEERNNGRARGVCLQTLRATVGDGENGEQHREIVGCQGSERQGLRG